MKPALVLSLVTVLGIGGTYLADESLMPTPVISPVIQLDEGISPLEKARRATFLISQPGYRGMSGSAILVGRKKLDNGLYRYRALTALHVLREMSDAMTKNPSEADKQLKLMFQPDFHGKPLRVDVTLDDLDWASIVEDWASITFDMSHKISCVGLATEAEFKAIKPFEKIYAVGCGGIFSQMCRSGIIGATNNVYLYTFTDNRRELIWNKYPHKFFRPYINVWYGDSGGGVFSKEGKLIGIINGYGMMRGWSAGPVTHSTIAVKAHIIKDLVSGNKDFFVIEE